MSVTNDEARTAYRRLGFRDESLNLIVEAERLSAARKEPSHGTVYVQTDDEGAVEKAVTGFSVARPRRSSPPLSAGSPSTTTPATATVTSQGRLARELSYRLGVVLALRVEEGQVVRLITLDEGRIVDEYVSLPEFRGPLPPGDVVALGSTRRRGAPDRRGPRALRAVARTADSSADLPRANELAASSPRCSGWCGPVITLYDAERCPYCARARIALAEKGIQHEVVAIDLSDRPPWLYEKNPRGKVPVIEEDGSSYPSRR